MRQKKKKAAIQFAYIAQTSILYWYHRVIFVHKSRGREERRGGGPWTIRRNIIIAIFVESWTLKKITRPGQERGNTSALCLLSFPVTIIFCGSNILHCYNTVFAVFCGSLSLCSFDRIAHTIDRRYNNILNLENTKVSFARQWEFSHNLKRMRDKRILFSFFTSPSRFAVCDNIGMRPTGEVSSWSCYVRGHVLRFRATGMADYR